MLPPPRKFKGSARVPVAGERKRSKPKFGVHTVFVAAVGFCLGVIFSGGSAFFQPIQSPVKSTASAMSSVLSSAFLFSPKIVRTGYGDAPIYDSFTSPQLSDLIQFREANCTEGSIDEPSAESPGGWEARFRSARGKEEWCADRAGEGSWDERGIWKFKYEKKCGHHWMAEGDICSMLTNFTVFYVGDSTSRRMGITLQSILSGLTAANNPFPCDKDEKTCPQLLPDYNLMYTDMVSRCIPRVRCRSCAVTGDLTQPVPSSVQTLSGVYASLYHRKSPQRYKAFPAIPFFSTFLQGPPLIAPMYEGFGQSLRTIHFLIKTMEKTYPHRKTLVIGNIGAWHLQGPKAVFQPPGNPKRINEKELPQTMRAEYLANFKKKKRNGPLESIHVFNQTRYVAALAIAAMKKGRPSPTPNALWVWRSSYPVDLSHPRFAAETDDEYANFSDIRPRMTRDHARMYMGNYNHAIQDWNGYIDKHVKEIPNFVTANAFNALYNESDATKRFAPKIDSYSGIHVNDQARKVATQIVLNAIAPHIAAMHERDRALSGHIAD